MTDKKKYIPILISSVISVLMVAVSEITGEPHIIFPEIAAIAIGMLAAPVQIWHTGKLRLLLTVTASALLGMAVVRFVPVSMYFKIPIGLTAVMILITMSQTNFLPAISACILPIMNSTQTLAYPLSVVITTGLILLAQHILEETGLRKKYHYVPIAPTESLIRLRLAQIIIVSLMCILPLAMGRPYFIAPPLIVAFAEMTAPSSHIKKNITTATVMITMSAFLGCSSRLLLSEIAGIPLAVAAAITCCTVMIAVVKTEFYFAPCGAIGLLPFLIPQHTLIRFPFALSTGFMIFALITVLSANHVKHEQEEAAKEKEAEHTEAFNHV